MAGKGPKIEKFETLNKALIKGRVGHSRTGACTAKGRCFHGMKPLTGTRGRISKKKTKI